MDLYNIIYQLVEENDCVIIPEFGGFVCNYFEAKIDLSNQEFYPPVKKIAFNGELKNNDGLLMNYLMREFNIDWKEAQNYVKSFVVELNFVLKSNNYLKFEKLGIFTVNDGVIVFKPFDNQNLLATSFGLKRFNFPMLKTAKKSVEIQKQPILSKSKEAKTNKKKRSISPALFYASAVAVIAGLVVIAFQFDLVKFEKQAIHENANIVPVQLLTNNSPSEIEENAIPTDNSTTEIIEDIEDNSSVNAETLELEMDDKDLVSTNLNVHVIGGSFSNVENANNYKQKLIDAGFSSQVLAANNGMYRVTVKSFVENSFAIAELQALRSKTGNQSLWVLCN
ncbi:MAG: SPOR domain-containing protein [Bacteroidales bacterium]|nr:SPOR domain-containing protein [Bacteroidales bacterium]